MAESNIGLRLCGRCSHVLTDRSAAWDYTETRTEQNKSNKKLDRSFSYSDATPTATTNTQTINHNTSTYDNNKEANIAAHSIHRMDKIKWFDPISNNNNIEITSNNNYITADKTEATSTATATSTTTTINYNSSTYNDNKQFRARKIEKGLSSNVVLARDFTRAFFTLRVKFMVYSVHHPVPCFDR
jgi:hypothetical protein